MDAIDGSVLSIAKKCLSHVLGIPETSLQNEMPISPDDIISFSLHFGFHGGEHYPDLYDHYKNNGHRPVTIRILLESLRPLSSPRPWYMK